MSKPEFLIYRSSAGSGKTQTLASEYLKLILTRRADFRHVLAITFTNKAAEEMKERVLDLLRLYASGVPLAEHHTLLLREIAHLGGISEDEVRARAGYSHREILHHYSDFHIGTIDSFTHRIIRSFALELNLSFAFEVQLETVSFIKMAVDDLLEKTGEDTELTSNLVSFTRMLLEDEKSWNIGNALTNFARFLTAEESMIPLEKLADADIDMRQVAASNRRAIREINNRWMEIAGRADAIIRKSGVAPDDFSHGRSSGLGIFFEKLLNDKGFDKIYHRRDSAKRMVGWMEEGVNAYKKGTPESLAAGIQDVVDALIPVWQELTTLVDELYPEYATRELIDQNLSTLSLSRKLREQMQVTMDRENLIPIYEFNRLIWNIIRSQPVPFIYERTSERYDHFLIDEFQDTSSLQWLNLLPLIENSLAQGGMSMVVGDGKQAIYRWRNGDVWQFVRLPEIKDSDSNPLLKSREEALKRYATPKNLNYNFRSAKEILAFNNELFTWLKGTFPEELDAIYDSNEQEAGNKKAKGYVEIHMIPEMAEHKSADYDRITAGTTLALVRDILDDPLNTLLPSDICILARKHAEAGVIASTLIEAGIDVVSGQSFMLKNFPEPLLFRAVAGLLLNRNDHVNAVVIATQLYREGRITTDIFQEKLSTLAGSSAGDGTLWSWVDDLLKRAGIDRRMAEYIAMPLYEICEQVIRDFFGKEATSPAVQYLLDTTGSFIRSFGNDMAAWLDFLDEKLNTSIPLPDTRHAVNIMTVHKAKGLQFPVVIYAFANECPENSNNRNKLLWVEDREEPTFEGLPVLLLPFNKKLTDTPFAGYYEQEESALLQDSVNVAYVALTRASQRLYVISAPKGQSKNSEKHFYRLLNNFLEESTLLTTDDNKTWSLGEKVPLSSSKRDTDTTGLRMPAWESSSWHGRLGIRTGSLHREYDEPRREALNRGVVMHTLLADIKCESDVEGVITKHLESGLIKREDAEAFRQEISALIEMEAVRPFFDTSFQQRNEAELITAEGKLFRPDRVVWLPDHIAVLDFKTGDPRPAHRKQVSYYCDLLAQMGNNSVKGYLLYIDSKILEAV